MRILHPTRQPLGHGRTKGRMTAWVCLVPYYRGVSAIVANIVLFCVIALLFIELMDQSDMTRPMLLGG